MSSSCPGRGPQPVHSHRAENCEGPVDETPEHVYDLAGNLRKLTRDSSTPYSGLCWIGLGILHDPICTVGGSPVARGGHFSVSPGVYLRATFSASGVPGESQGFRCAYLDGE